MDIEGQLLKEDQILLAYLKSLFKGIGRTFRVKKVTRLLKKETTSCDRTLEKGAQPKLYWTVMEFGWKNCVYEKPFKNVSRVPLGHGG